MLFLKLDITKPQIQESNQYLWAIIVIRSILREAIHPLGYSTPGLHLGPFQLQP